MNAQEIIADLKKLRNVRNIEGMARFGINPDTALGISIVTLRKKAKEIGKNHKLALELWNSGIHEIRILATMIDNSEEVTKSQMNSWVKDFNSWDLCDQCCNNLFRKTMFAKELLFKWVKSKHEFTRRAGFVLMATHSVHKKEMTNDDFLKYLPLIIDYSQDERNFVKKAVNWALRQIGKRNMQLNEEAIKVCKTLLDSDSKSANWIAKDALRELTSEKLIFRLNKIKMNS
ncbi:MAG: DNA alkylation repair protein [Melioribacteraceae bacterium]|nr:DNA alkylation repair protein [Melioribacteraceae bacterium]